MPRNNITVHAVEARDFKRFPNVKAFLDDFTGFQYYPKHLQLLSQLHGEICGFCSKQETVEHMPELDAPAMQDIVFLAHGVCPRCGRTKLDNLRAHHWLVPTQMAIAAGQRSGKGFLAALAALYSEHLMLTLEISGEVVTPAEYFGLIVPKDLSGYFRSSFVACSMDTALYTFQITKDLRNSSKWFRDYRSFLDLVGARKGVEMYAETGTSLAYHHTQMLVIAEAADVHTIRGKTRYFAASDDMAWCELADKPYGAAVHKALDISLRTMRLASDNRIKAAAVAAKYWDLTAIGQNLLLTTRRFVDDMFQEIKRDSLLDPRIFLREYATWEFNPRYHKAEFDEWFKQDSAAAHRDFAVFKGVQDPVAA